MSLLEYGKDTRLPAQSASRADLKLRLTAQIERRASGRIRDLDVVCSDTSIILRGRSRSYHAKQLAQQAVLDLTDGYPLLTNQIEVY